MPTPETTFVTITHRPARLEVYPFAAPVDYSPLRAVRARDSCKLVHAGRIRHPYFATGVRDPECAGPGKRSEQHARHARLPPPPPTDEVTSEVTTYLTWSGPVVAGNTAVRYASGRIRSAPKLETVTQIPVLAVYDHRSGRERFVRTVPWSRGQYDSWIPLDSAIPSPDGKFISWTDPVKQELQVLDSETGVTKWSVPGQFVRVFLTGGSRLALFDKQSGAVRVHATATGEVLQQIDGVVSKPSGAEWIQLSPDGRFLLVWSQEKLVVIDTSAWAIRYTVSLESSVDQFSATQFTPDGRSLMVQPSDRLTVIDINTWTIRNQLGSLLRAPNGRSASLGCSVPARSRIASSSHDGIGFSPGQVETFEVWDLHTGKQWSRFELRANAAVSSTSSPRTARGCSPSATTSSTSWTSTATRGAAHSARHHAGLNPRRRPHHTRRTCRSAPTARS